MPRDRTTADTVYEFIRHYIETHEQLSPSIREIADGCYLGLSTAAYYVRELQLQGRIKRERYVARSIRLVQPETAPET